MPPLLIGPEEVRELLSMAECIEVMDQAMRTLSAGRVDAPARLVIPLDGGHFFLMPGSLADGPVFGAKLVSLLPGNPGSGLPAVQGTVALFDSKTGSPLAFIDGAAITALRTAAASALATRELARPDAASHGVFGAGLLAGEHIRAIACVRPIREVRVWARNPERAGAFCRRMAGETRLPVISATPEEAAACDIVTTVTNSPEPVLQGRWLLPGCHLNLVGAHDPAHREADSDAVAAAAIHVDSRAGALKESGDILVPLGEGRIGKEAIRGEIGQVLLGEVTGRRNGTQITLYKSLGHVAQDLYAAEAVLRRASGGG